MSRTQGTVTVEMLIDAQGRVARSRVVQSVPALDAAALARVRTWRFAPARKGGRPVDAIVQAPIVFRLD